MAGRKVFAPVTPLTAADVNGYLMDQTVPRFASVADRDSQWPSAPNGARCAIGSSRWYKTGGVWVPEDCYLGSNVGGGAQPLGSADTIIALTTSGVWFNGITVANNQVTMGYPGMYEFGYTFTFYAPNATGQGELFIQAQYLTPSNAVAWNYQSNGWVAAGQWWTNRNARYVTRFSAGDKIQFMARLSTPNGFYLDGGMSYYDVQRIAD